MLDNIYNLNQRVRQLEIIWYLTMKYNKCDNIDQDVFLGIVK